jgi:hypothetical protein
MKHLKTYENSNVDKPKVGDYVILIPGFIKYFNDTIRESLTNNIGVIVGTKYKLMGKFLTYQVSFDGENYPRTEPLIVSPQIEQILHWSSNKEDCEIIIQSNNFNL